MLAPEGFLQFVQSIRVAEAEIGEFPPIELSQQAPCVLARSRPCQKPLNSRRTRPQWGERSTVAAETSCK